MISFKISGWAILLLSDEDEDLLNWKWREQGGYIYRIDDETGERLLIHNVIAKRIGLIGLIDHRDRNKANNQRDNLREANYNQQMANRKTINSTSGFKGVSKKGKRYYANITFNYKKYFLGAFDSAIEAAKAYDKAALDFNGEFAFLNFPSNAKNG